MDVQDGFSTFESGQLPITTSLVRRIGRLVQKQTSKAAQMYSDMHCNGILTQSVSRQLYPPTLLEPFCELCCHRHLASES